MKKYIKIELVFVALIALSLIQSLQLVSKLGTMNWNWNANRQPAVVSITR